MARIVDKDTRLIDVDFGPFSVNIARQATQDMPTGVPGSIATIGGAGEGDLLRFYEDGEYAGSALFYRRIDLNMMAENNEVMQPVEVSVQRTTNHPYGRHENGNNFDQIQEFLFVFSRPLNNDGLSTAGIQIFDALNEMGLDFGTGFYGGLAGGVSQVQNIYAEKRTYVWDKTTGATRTNGELLDGPGSLLSSYFGQSTLQDVNTWGSLSSITGPNLHCYRIILMKAQSFPALGLTCTNVDFEGFSSIRFPPLNATFLCKDPSLSEGEYLTRLANAMGKLPEGGQSA